MTAEPTRTYTQNELEALLTRLIAFVDQAHEVQTEGCYAPGDYGWPFCKACQVLTDVTHAGQHRSRHVGEQGVGRD